MKMKMKMLASTVSLLCFGQMAMAAQCDAPAVCSTSSIDGIIKTFVFASQAEADAISAELGKGQDADGAIVGPYTDPFANPDTGALPATSTGLVTQTTRNGQPVTIVQTSPYVATVTQIVNGESKVTTITRTSSSSPKMGALIDGFVKEGATAAVLANDPVKDGIDEVAYSAVQKYLADVKAIPATAGSLEAQAQEATSSSISKMLLNTVPTPAAVTSTVTINGITQTLDFSSQLSAQSALNSPDAATKALFGNPTSYVGQVIQATSGGATSLIVQTDAKTAVVGVPNANGTIEYVTLRIPTASQTTLNKLTSAYLNGDEAAFNSIAGAVAINGIPDDATATTLNSLLVAAKNQGGLKAVAGSFTLAMVNDAVSLDSTKAKISSSVLAANNYITSAESARVAALRAIATDPTKTQAEKDAALAELNTVLAAEATIPQSVKDDVIIKSGGTVGVVYPVDTIVILNGVAKTYTFASQAAAEAAANNPLTYRADFKNPTTGAFPNSLVGMVTISTSNGKTVVLVRTSNDTVIIGEQDTAAKGKKAVDLGALTNIKYTSVKATTSADLNAKVSTYLTKGTGNVAPTDADLTSLTTYLNTARQADLAAFPGLAAQLQIAYTQAVIAANGTLPPSQNDIDYVTKAVADADAAINIVLAEQGVVNAGIGADAANLAGVTGSVDALKALNKDISAQKDNVDIVKHPLLTAAEAKAAKKAANDDINALEGKRVAKIVDGVLTEGIDGGMNVNAQRLVNNLALAKSSGFQAANTRGSSAAAGSPTRIMNMTVDSMFNQAADYGNQFGNNTTNIASASSDGGIKTSFSAGLQYGYYDVGGTTSNTVSLPLSVTAQLNPKHALTLSVPLSYIQTQSASDAYQVGVGLAYKYSLNDNWSLTPAVSYAYRSFDNQQNEYANPLSSTELVGGAITSKYTWNLQANALKVSLINMIGYYESLDSNNNASKTLNLTNSTTNFGLGAFTGMAANQTISNYVIKNGLHASKNMGNFDVGAYFTDTEYFGSSLYLEQFNEIGFSMKPQNMSSYLNALSVDANYLFSIGGKHSSQLDGFRLNLNYKY